MSVDDKNDLYIPTGEQEEEIPEKSTQEELSNLIRDLKLSKDGAEYLASVFKKKRMISKGTTASFYRDKEKEFRKYFTEDKKQSLVYCFDIDGSMDQLKPGVYKDEDWRLFINSSKRSFKAVLLHNTNIYGLIPMAHTTEFKESYESVKLVLDKIKYQEHNWQICGDSKILSIILGQQAGFTKTPFFYICGIVENGPKKNLLNQGGKISLRSH